MPPEEPVMKVVDENGETYYMVGHDASDVHATFGDNVTITYMMAYDCGEPRNG